MVRMSNRILVGVLLVALSGVAYASKTHESDDVSFSQKTIVNGTPLKAGTYHVRFDFNSNTLSVLRAGKVVAEVPATVTTQARKSSETEVESETTGDAMVLKSIIFKGDNRVITVTGATAGGAEK